MKRNAIKKVNEDYKRNCQAIPEEPKNDKVFSYGTKFKKYNEYKNEIVATTYNGFMKLLSERFGKNLAFTSTMPTYTWQFQKNCMIE